MAAREQRRRTFSTSLDQAEELWQASELIRPNASPIVLFYSLTQAARALCAVRVPGDDWNAVPAHGLTLLAPDAQGDQAPPLEKITVKAKRKGFVQQVAALLHSPVLEGAVTLRELLCSLPEHRELMLFDSVDARPLEVHDSTSLSRSSSEPSNEVVAVVEPLPPELVRSQETEAGYREMLPPTLAEVVSWLARYPMLAAAGSPSVVGYVNPMGLTRSPQFGVRLHWVLPEAIPVGQSSKWFRSIVDVVTDERGGAGHSGIAIPAVAGNAAALDPLIAWWIVLYTCSMLARYHPRSWVALLDVDSSTSAVALERVLELARAVVPGLLLDRLLETDA